MRTHRIICLLVGIMLICTGQAYSQEMRVGVFIPGGEEVSLEVLKETLSYYLSSCGDCTAVEFDNLLEEETEDALKKLAGDFDLDFAVFLTETGLGLYESSSGETKKESPGDLSDDPYTGAHRFLRSFLDNVLDISNSWGTLELTPRGADGAYTVEIDGFFAGDSVKAPIPVPNGDHVIAVIQERPFGTQILLEERMTIEQGSTKKMTFAVPELTDLEKRAFEAIDAKILEAWESEPDTVKEQFDLLDSLFEGIEATKTVDGYRNKYKTWKTEYQAGRGASDIVVEEPADEPERDEIAAEIERDLDLSVVIREQLPPPGAGAIALASIGPLIGRTGGVIHSLVHDSKFTQPDESPTPFSYANLTYDIAGDDAGYFWSVLGLWGSAGIAKPLLFPYSSYTLSPGGKAVQAAGIAFDTIGSIFTLMSRIAGANWSMAEDESFSTNGGGKMDDPEEYRTAQAFTGITGYASWILGTAASVTAPLIPGYRSYAVSGGFQKVLLTAGSIFEVLGNIASVLAYNARIYVDIRSRAYDSADFSFGEDKAYERYESTYAIYLGSTIATYSFWGLGAISSILAIVLPEPPAAEPLVDETRPEPLFLPTLRVEPDFAGVTLWL